MRQGKIDAMNGEMITVGFDCAQTENCNITDNFQLFDLNLKL